MKRKNKEKTGAKTLIAFTAVLALIVLFVFLIPAFSTNKLAAAFNKEGITYQMMNRKHVASVYVVYENQQRTTVVKSPLELAEEDLRGSYGLDEADFRLTNSGIFYLVKESEEEGSETIVGYFWHCSKGSEQVYSAVADSALGETAINTIAIRKGKYVFLLLGNEIPSSMENVLKSLSGKREQTLSD